jgi:hypothetical protein
MQGSPANSVTSVIIIMIFNFINNINITVMNVAESVTWIARCMD